MQRGIVVCGLVERDVGIFRGIPHIGSYRRPMPLARRRSRECWSWGAPRLDTVREHQNLWLLIGVTGARARMALDHSLGRKECLNLFTQNGNAFGLPHPFGTFCTESKALKAKTNARLTTPLGVRLFVTFLSPYPTSVAARLSAHCAFSFGRPGFLGDFSGGRSGGRRYVTTNRRIVRHLGVSLRETEGERERK